MDAHRLLEEVASAFSDEGLEVVLVGSAAAALRGAPVTTEDFDFMFRPTRRNLAKLREVARALGGSVTQPQYPLSRFYRISSSSGLQVDVLGVLDGVKSFESLRSRADEVLMGRASLMVASLRDVIASKRAAGRLKDLAALPVLEETLELSGEEEDR
jgi:predicted nucleotidyltransferase